MIIIIISLKILSLQRGIILAKMNLELFPVFVHFPLLIVNIFLEFQVYNYVQ